MSQLYETSEAIVAGIGNGDRKAEIALIEKYGRSLLYILERRTGDPDRAQDLQQDTFIIILQKLRVEPLSDPSKLSAYLHKTATNLEIGHIRKEVRRKTRSDSEFVEMQVSKEDDQYAQLLRQRSIAAVRSIINGLSNDRDRRLLTLYYVEDRDKDFICQELALDFRHFDRVISRARRRFRALLESEKQDINAESET